MGERVDLNPYGSIFMLFRHSLLLGGARGSRRKPTTDGAPSGDIEAGPDFTGRFGLVPVPGCR